MFADHGARWLKAAPTDSKKTIQHWKPYPLVRINVQVLVKNDERALRTFVQRYIQLPLPDYGARHLLLQAFAQVTGSVLLVRPLLVSETKSARKWTLYVKPSWDSLGNTF
jgi:hypothetical protein